jgi:AraC family transcriptional regulator, L-rhamnose operon regulatory protein RhaS
MQKTPRQPSPIPLLHHGTTISVDRSAPETLPLWIMSLDQEASKDTHAHDFIELVYVNSGSGLHVHGSRRYPIFAGDCFVVVPGQHHGYDEERNLNITNFLFYPELVEPFRKELLKASGFVQFFTIEPLFRSETSFRYKLHLSLSQQESFQRLRAALEQELFRQGTAYRAMATSLFVQMIIMLSRHFAEMLSTRQVRSEFDGKERTVAAAIAFLEQNYANDVSVEDVARSAYVSASRLSHVFKQATGMSLLDYLTRMRTDRAVELLSSTDRNITEIAYELGFHDPSYFARAFRKVAGVTPSQFRARLTKGNG